MRSTTMSFNEKVFPAIESLHKEDQIAILHAICAYTIDGEQTFLSGPPQAIWFLAKDYIDECRQKFVGNKLPEKRKQFQKPSVPEIIEYVQEMHPCASAERIQVFANQFYSFYESKGWKVGKNPMKNWKAALVTWKDTMDKTIYIQNPAPNMNLYRGSWEHRQLEYLKGMQSIMNDENL